MLQQHLRRLMYVIVFSLHSIFYNYKYFQLNTGETPITPPSPAYPCQGIVLYDFESANEDELSVRKDEKIFVQAKFESDGWLVAKGRDGTGLVPESYVQLIPILQPTPTEPGSYMNLSSHLSLIFALGSTKTSLTDGDNKNKKKPKNKKETSNASAAEPSMNVFVDEADDFSDN